MHACDLWVIYLTARYWAKPGGYANQVMCQNMGKQRQDGPLFKDLKTKFLCDLTPTMQDNMQKKKQL